MQEPHYVELSGTPRQRGRIHGEALREVIGEVIGRWEAVLGSRTGMSLGDYVEHVRRTTGFAAAIFRGAPELLEEVRGIGEGSGIGFDLAFTWQLFDEHGWILREMNEAGDKPADKCSALGIQAREDRPAIVAQNLDIPLIKDGAQTVLRIALPGSDLSMLVVAQAGGLASLGVNSCRLGICVNELSQLTPSRTGLPVSYMIRRALEQPDLAAAERFLTETAHASGQNFIVASPNGVCSLECSAGDVARYRPLEDCDDCYHTNHPLANEDIRPGLRGETPGPVGETPPSTSRARFTQLEAAFAGNRPRTVGDARKILSTEPVCVRQSPTRDNLSAVSAVIELGSTPVLHVASGPPDEHSYHAYSI